jgi:enoyl-CoA hydratase/carnithine racemase
VSLANGVAAVRLARPEKHNALDSTMFGALAEAQEQVRNLPGVRVVVLSGEGPSFCSGLDLAAAAAGSLDFDALWTRRDGAAANLAQTAAMGWRSLEVPVIAAIQGACFGGGLQIALGADIRIAAADARLSVMEVRLGLVPDMGITVSLPLLVNLDVAMELALSGRIVEGTEAAAIGLVTRLADSPEAAAAELAGKLAAQSPDALRSIKRLFIESWGEGERQSLSLETELVRALLGRPNQLEAVRAAAAGEPPVFIDPPPPDRR